MITYYTLLDNKEKTGFDQVIINRNCKPDAEIEEILLKYCDKTKRFKTDIYELIPTWEYDGAGRTKWLSLGNSLYGAVISALLEAGSVAGLLVALPCIAVGGVQGTILYNLWWSLPPLYQNNDDSPGFCSLDSRLIFLQTCIIGVFIVSLGTSFMEIHNEFVIVRSAKIRFGHHNTGEAHFKKLLDDQLPRFLALVIVLYEIAIWVIVLLVGILYILTTEGVGNIVQAAVAISYINDIDNMAVEIIFGDISDLVRNEKFRCQMTIPSYVRTLMTWFFGTPLIICISCGIVYGLHNTYCH